VAVVLLAGARVAYDAAARGLDRMREHPIELPVPLAAIPMQVGAWVGRDVNIPVETEAYMRRNFADDFISRQYRNTADGRRADVYVVYCSSFPGGLLGHKPAVCRPGFGWSCDRTTVAEVTSVSGRTIRCLIQLFHKPALGYEQDYVLSFYVLNGQTTLDEREFSGFWSRRPNIAGDPARYVAQVQISSPTEQVVRSATRDLVDTILRFLPDRDEAAPLTSHEVGASQGIGDNP